MPSYEQRETLPVHTLPPGLPTPEQWRLQVDGLVRQPLTLAMAEIEALGPQQRTADFACEEGWVVPAQQWEGIPVATILARAGTLPEARYVKVYASDFTVLLPLKEVDKGEALLARSLNGAPLTPEHGAPLRLMAPGRACWYSVKWVTRLEVLAEEVPTTGESMARRRLSRGGETA